MKRLIVVLLLALVMSGCSVKPAGSYISLTYIELARTDLPKVCQQWGNEFVLRTECRSPSVKSPTYGVVNIRVK